MNITYEYKDSQREGDYTTNKISKETIGGSVYEYSYGGNITSKKEYAYNTDTLSNSIKMIEYEYENSNWKDQLTSYNLIFDSKKT